jgi:hypothetical protein
MKLENIDKAFDIIRNLNRVGGNVDALEKISKRISTFNILVQHKSHCVNENTIIELDEELLNIIVKHLKTKEAELMTELELM